MKKNKKGISLIVLIITVLVLAILATVVVINISESNIMGEAENAISEYNKKQYEQQLTLAYAGWLADNKGEKFETDNIDELENYGIKLSEVPSGFAVAVENNVPVLIVIKGGELPIADVWDGNYPASVTTFALSGDGTEINPYQLSM